MLRKQLEPTYDEGVFKRWILCKDGMFRMDYVAGFGVNGVDDFINYIDFYVYEHEKGFWNLCDTKTGFSICGTDMFQATSRDYAVKIGVSALFRSTHSQITYEQRVNAINSELLLRGVPNNLPAPDLETMRENMLNRRNHYLRSINKQEIIQ